ncbi:MAG: ATP phosphoribosyltransferase [Proteobacteria bacterium]|jgi:ATP phosphoribosyltransferase|nr:ATP phosphoribosyltransferase [Pseudomonadota bacterium]
MITIALSKGRIYKQSLPLLAAAGVEPTEDPETSRKLILDTTQASVKLVVIRATDVPTYVQFGAADIGFVGKDTLMEHSSHGISEMLDLGISRCRLSVAYPADAKNNGKRQLKIATKYVNIANRYFATKGIQTEIIKLYGSMELAPLVGLADCIVDLVETGNTLKANNMVEGEVIANISCRLIANNAALKTRHSSINELVEKIGAAVNNSAK